MGVQEEALSGCHTGVAIPGIIIITTCYVREGRPNIFYVKAEDFKNFPKFQEVLNTSAKNSVIRIRAA